MPDSSLKLNQQLAENLGWTNIVDVGGTLLGTPPDGAPNSRGQTMIPNWAGDDATAFQLHCKFIGTDPEIERRIIVLKVLND